MRGVGYYVKELRRHLRQILGLDGRVAIAIMGAGNLGLALADYPGFRDEGFEIAALFDTMRDKIGHRSRAGVPIHDIREFRTHRPPRAHPDRGDCRAGRMRRKSVVNTVVSAGVKAVLNFSPGTLKVPAGREAEERRPDGLARKPVVLPGAGRSRCVRRG